MNEQKTMMNQQQQMMNPPPPMVSNMSQPPPPQMLSQHHQQQPQPQVIKYPRQNFQSELSLPLELNFDTDTNYPKPPKLVMEPSRFSSQNSQNSRSYSQILMNLSQPQQPPQMMNRSYGMWGPPPQTMDLPLNYQNPNPNHMKGQAGGFVSSGKPLKHPLGPRNNWKGKKINKPDKRMDLGRRMDKTLPMGGSTSGGVPGNLGSGIGGGYKPPTLNELQHQNRMKARRFFPKKNFNKNKYNMGKFAPRNTTSFIIRAKKSGGIAELVSPCPVTPAVLPTPMFSPSREVLVDMAKEEWGVDGYGSMKGLIRLRSPGHDTVEGHEDDDEEDEGGSSESDVEEHVEVERRLDHDLSRFEMIYPNYGTVTGVEYNNVLENRVDDQDTHIAQLEEENLILKERLFLMERELGDLRRRLQCLERQNHGEEVNEEVVENESENDSESRGDAHSMEVNNEEMIVEHFEASVEDKNIVSDARKFPNEQKFADPREEKRKDENQVGDVEVEVNDDVNVNVVNKNNANLEASENNKHMNVNAVEDNNANLGVPESRSVQGDVLMQVVVPSGKEMAVENP